MVSIVDAMILCNRYYPFYIPDVVYLSISAILIFYISGIAIFFKKILIEQTNYLGQICESYIYKKCKFVPLYSHAHMTS